MKKRVIRAILRDTRAPDLFEYALMAGFVIAASALLMPDVATSVSGIFSRVSGFLGN